MTNKIIDYQMELARPYHLWVLHNRWFCINEVVINRTTYEDGTIKYVVEITDYREIERISAGYRRALYKLERYNDDNSEHCYEKIATFNSFDAAMQYVDIHYPPIDLEQEISRYYTFDEDDDDDEI